VEEMDEEESTDAIVIIAVDFEFSIGNNVVAS
jgi:hypothetical protein